MAGRLNPDLRPPTADLAFIVLEGFSGTGKTSLARALEARGWVRLTESAHAVPSMVPLAERADTFADYSLFGRTMVYCSEVSRLRGTEKLVSEGYFLSDLAYARVRQELGKSTAFPFMLDMCRSMLRERSLRPDLYVVLEAPPHTIGQRQLEKVPREKNLTEYFRTRYYSALEELHEALGERNVERLTTEGDVRVALASLIELLARRGLGEK